MGGARSSAEIRDSIESNRAELAIAVDRLKGEVQRATDFKRQFEAHKTEILLGAAVAGFVIGGGIAALGGLFRRRRGY